MILTGSGVIKLKIGDFSLQGVDAATADEAVEKLAFAIKNCALFSASSVLAQFTSTTDSQHE